MNGDEPKEVQELRRFGCTSTALSVHPLTANVHLPFADERDPLHYRVSLHWDNATQVHLRLVLADLVKLLELLESIEDGGVEGEDFLFSLEMLSDERASLTIVRPAQLFGLQMSLAEIAELARIIRIVVEAPAELRATALERG